MRYSLLIGLALFVPIAPLCAEESIPQDPVRMEKRHRERLEWNRQTLARAYDQVGKKDPRWDKAAHEALDLAARMFSQQFDPVVTFQDVHVPAKQAIDAGCDDPLIAYLYFRSSAGKQYPGREEYDRRGKAAARAMMASAYSPYRRAVAQFHAVERDASKKNPTDTERRETEQGLDAVLDELPKSIAQDTRNEFWEDGWYTTINSVIAAHRQLGDDYKAVFDRVDARLAKMPGIEALRLTVTGNFQMNWGWEARTTAFAVAVSDDQFRTFQTRLEAARAALQGAWKANPDEPHVADLMLAVEKSIGQGDRQAMETWFERAMKADGNDKGACWGKLDWLDPKWYGGNSWDAMMAFGKACGATKNWHTGITLLAADAHLRKGTRLDPAAKKKYFQSPEAWNEIRAVYNEYLKHYPGDNAERSKYAMLCYLGDHFPEAHAQFQAVGDGLTRWSTFPNFPIEDMRRSRDTTARIMANIRRTGTSPTLKPDGPPKRSG